MPAKKIPRRKFLENSKKLLALSLIKMIPSDAWGFTATKIRRALKSSPNKLWAWGFAGRGALGITGSTNIKSPESTPNSGPSFTAFSAGGEHSHIIKPDGTLWATGRSQAGQLGDGTLTTRSTFLQVGAATNWSQVAGSQQGGYAIQSNGSLWSWGASVVGHPGILFLTPGQVTTNTTWTEVCSAAYTSFAIRSNGTLWTWGWAGDGTTGIADPQEMFASPNQVNSVSTWTKISCGEYFAIGLRSNGTMWSWGDNTQGYLGLGNTTSRSTPVQVGVDTNWLDISSGLEHTIAQKS